MGESWQYLLDSYTNIIIPVKAGVGISCGGEKSTDSTGRGG